MYDTQFITGGASREQIGWLLFVTDNRVKEFASKQADGRLIEIWRVASAMWLKDEQGWRTECLQRAMYMSFVNIHPAYGNIMAMPELPIEE